MTTLSQEQETQPHPLTSTPPKGTRRPSQPSLLSRQCSEQLDQPHQPLQPLQPNQHHHGHYHRRPSALGSFSQSRERPSMTSQSSFCGQRPPGSSVFGHFRSHQQPQQQQQQHHHHHSHPRLSQKNRQKLFSRSRGYKSVCSGSGSQHGTCPSRSRCTADTTASMSRDHHDEDIEACQPYHPWPEEPSSVISERCTRARINSAIFVSSEGRGFDSIEFIRRYGSQSVLCRKARSAENVSASERQRRFSEYPEWESEENKQYGKMNGYEHCGPDGASSTNAEPRQDSIELVECHREPGSTTTTTNQPVTVTPAVVVLPLPVGGSSSSKCCASASGGCNGSSSGAGDYVCLDGHHSKTTPKLSNLPTLSVSGPSPPHEEEFLL